MVLDLQGCYMNEIKCIHNLNTLKIITLAWVKPVAMGEVQLP